MMWFLFLFTLLPPQESDFPNPKSEIWHIIPWGAGGATDTAMRGFMKSFERHLGVPVRTKNIPGGLTAVGLMHLKRARPDGYTIGTITYDVLTLEYQGFAPVRWEDFAIIGMVTEHPSALIVSAKRFKNLKSFRAEARALPGKIKVGNVGTGGIWHQHAGAIEKSLGLNLTHVPYQAGSSAQLAALLGGEVDANVASLPASLPYVNDGSLRVLAVMAEERDVLVPHAPTFQEKGFTNLVYGGFRVVVAPKSTPLTIVRELEESMHNAWKDNEFQLWASKVAIGARWRNGEETRLYLRDLSAKVEILMQELELN